MKVRGFKHALLVAGFSAFSTIVAAGQIGGTIEGNDCSGVFGQGFENCRIPAEYDPNRSPIIIKFNFNDNGSLGQVDINSALFPTITGNEFSFVFGSGGTGTGTWTYNPGAGDPLINFFVAKGGHVGFTLFSNTGDMNTDTWTTPLNGQNRAGLSHLSFYDTRGPNGGGEIPEPATLGLLGLGLVGLALMRRRRQS